MLAVQRFLRSESLEALEAQYAVKWRRHGIHDNLVLLKYNQIESPFKEEVVQDCRGIILDAEKNWDVVCMTYRKFFNHGETLAADIDWATAKVYEKLDGSLIQLYNYGGRWHVATSGTPDADCQINDFGSTFAELFWLTAKHLDLKGEKLDPECCYAFELCSPLNRVVVRHDTARLWLHGVRHLPTLTEEKPEPHAERMGIPVAPSYALADLDAVLGAVGKLDPLAQEGYVVRDAFFNRVKIKSPAYVALHHAKDGLLSRRMMSNVIRSGEGSEMQTALGAFPELATEFEKLVATYEGVVRDAAVTYSGIINSLARDATRKQFALESIKRPQLSGILFHLLDSKPEPDIDPLVMEASIRGYLARLHEKAYMRLIGLKDEPEQEMES